MELINKTDQKITFSAEMSDSLANAIRRYLHHIPVLAIDEVEISKNDSPLYDETIAHRIGLVPIKTNKSTKQEYEVNLSVKGEKTVYSGDITGNAEVVHDKILLDILNKGKELELKGTVRAGTGAEHAKFSPGLMFYRNECEIKMSKDHLEEVQRICPHVKIEEKGQNIIVHDNKEREVCDVCEGIADKSGEKAEVTEKDNQIITIESFGQLPVEKMFEQSIEALKKDLDTVSKELK